MRRCVRLLVQAVPGPLPTGPSAAAASASAAAAAAAPQPLLPTQFRIIVRELRAHEIAGATRHTVKANAAAASAPAPAPAPAAAAASVSPRAARYAELRANFRSVLTIRAPDVSLHPIDAASSPQQMQEHHEHTVQQQAGQDAAPAAESPARSLANRLIRLLGMDKAGDSLRVIQSISAHCADPRWEQQCGFTTSPFSQLHLRALHLWLLYVRLRADPSDDPSRTRMFEMFWLQCAPLFASQRQMASAHTDVYAAWRALDEALMLFMQAQSEADQAQSPDGTSSATPPSERMVHLPSAVFGAEGVFGDGGEAAVAAAALAPDVHLLGALWRHTFLSSPTLNPYHLARLLRYVLDTLHALQLVSVDVVAKGDFTFLPPPAPTDSSDTSSGDTPPLTTDEQATLNAYYELFQKATPPTRFWT